LLDAPLKDSIACTVASDDSVLLVTPNVTIAPLADFTILSLLQTLGQDLLLPSLKRRNCQIQRVRQNFTGRQGNH
jgi:hypothetical protein